VQFGAVSGVMRTQANGVALPSKDRPQVIDEDQIGNWRRYTKLRTQLYPYLVAAQKAYRRSGMPLMRHMSLVAAGEKAARDDQFMFGPHLLAAPVVEEGARDRRVDLPGGRWVDLWRSAELSDRHGALVLDRARVLRGGKARTIPAPLEELPLLVRAGAVIPLLPPEVDTLADFADKGVVTLDERRRELELLAFPRGKSTARFGEKGRIVSREGESAWKLRVRRSQARRFELQASLTAMRWELEPCELRVDGKRLRGRDSSYDRRAEVLEASFAGRSPTLVASERGCR
jgi:alpha-glucosidase (family GH31 glycosyl hydrolase)